jgi:hypothetical protein
MTNCPIQEGHQPLSTPPAFSSAEEIKRGNELMVTRNDSQGQLIICCRVRLSAAQRWYIESAFTNRFAWTGTHSVRHLSRDRHQQLYCKLGISGSGRKARHTTGVCDHLTYPTWCLLPATLHRHPRFRVRLNAETNLQRYRASIAH